MTQQSYRPSLLNRIARVLLCLVFLVPTTLIFHGDVSNAQERIQLFKNLAIIGGLVLVADQDRGS
jgi:putative oxidoreductase